MWKDGRNVVDDDMGLLNCLTPHNSLTPPRSNITSFLRILINHYEDSIELFGVWAAHDPLPHSSQDHQDK